ncbi:hypothetical protein NQ845_17550 [Acinetobacter baumannii]|nr:hypothetical protein [Acinetobacter baumannii]
MALKSNTALELDWLKWLQSQYEYSQNSRGITLEKVQCIIELDADGNPSFGIEVVPLVIESTGEAKL